MKKFFNYINGNKTLICTVVLYALTLGIVKESLHPDVIKFTEFLFMTLAGVSLAHKVQKTIVK